MAPPTPHFGQPTPKWVRRLPWGDAAAGLAAGTAVLLLRSSLAGWYGMPLEVVTAMGLTNLGYASFGTALGLKGRSTVLIRLLASANMLWGVVCLAALGLMWSRLTAFGAAHLIIEGLLVGGLGAFEWRIRAHFEDAPAQMGQ